MKDIPKNPPTKNFDSKQFEETLHESNSKIQNENYIKEKNISGEKDFFASSEDSSQEEEDYEP